MVSLVGFAKPGGFGRNRNHLVSFGFETETMVSLDHYNNLNFHAKNNYKERYGSICYIFSQCWNIVLSLWHYRVESALFRNLLVWTALFHVSLLLCLLSYTPSSRRPTTAVELEVDDDRPVQLVSTHTLNSQQRKGNKKGKLDNVLILQKHTTSFMQLYYNW